MKQPANSSLPDPTQALVELYQTHVHVLLGYISRHVANLADAEDVLLEVFLAAQKRNALGGLSQSEQIAWLRRVALNKCIDLQRLNQRRPAIALDGIADTLYEDEQYSPEASLLMKERRAALYRHLAELPDQQQIIVRLHFAHDLPAREIARLLRKNESTVRMTLARALNRLRAAYQRDRVAEGAHHE